MKAAKGTDIHCEKRAHCCKHSHAHAHLQPVFVGVVHQSLLTDSRNQEPEMLSTSTTTVLANTEMGEMN